ncbi:40S small subunit processome assembly factor 1 [Rhinophrynus dorsalis]
MAGTSMEVTNQLDSVLGSLYDFGEDFMRCGKKLTKSISDIQQSQEIPKAKEIGKELNLNVQPSFPDVCSSRRKKDISLFFKSLKDELSCPIKPMELPSKDPHNNIHSAQGEHSVEVVTFTSRRFKKKNTEAKQDRDPEILFKVKERTGNGDAFNFEKARLEVHKFGITGYKKEKQRTFEQERAIMLGARPPKKEYLNYKVYQEKVKEKKIIKEESRTEKSLESVTKKQNQGQEVREKKAKSSGRVVPTGQVGKFKNGALILSAKDIKKIKQSKVIKR